MQDIKFRQRINGRWHFWGFLKDERGNIYFASPITGKSSMEDVIKNSQQFTGLKDNNGSDIYDKDILRYLIADRPFFEELYEVSYSEERACWQINCIKKCNHRNSPQFIAYHLTQTWASCFEVIGNIFENSDLLKTR